MVVLKRSGTYDVGVVLGCQLLGREEDRYMIGLGGVVGMVKFSERNDRG